MGTENLICKLNDTIWADEMPFSVASGKVQCRERLGGMLKYYYRTVA